MTTDDKPPAVEPAAPMTDAADDPVLADDGYPSDAELDRIRTWPIKAMVDCLRLMEYVEPRWAYGDWGWHRNARPQREHKNGSRRWYYSISTAGWSGNESIIGALTENHIWWMLCWWSERRGGHYRFRVPFTEPGPYHVATATPPKAATPPVPS